MFYQLHIRNAEKQIYYYQNKEVVGYLTKVI